MRKLGLRTILKIAAAGVSVPALLAAGCYLKWRVFDGKLATITPGAIFQSAAFAPDALVETCEAYGIRTVIDLRDSRPALVAESAAAATAAGILHLHTPTRSHPFWDDADAFLKALETAERPVLVHCQHGEGRSVLMCALHRIVNEGWTNQGAFDGTARLPDGLRFLNAWFPGLRRFQATHPKGRFVLEYGTAASARRRAHYEEHERADDLGATPR